MSNVQINNCSLANVHKFRCASPSGTSFCFLLGISFCIAGTQTGGFVFQRLCWLGEALIQATSFHLGCHLLVFLSIFLGKYLLQQTPLVLVEASWQQVLLLSVSFVPCCKNFTILYIIYLYFFS